MKKHPLQVAVSGGIAVGKTTLVQQLSSRLPQCTALVEYPERNPYLADFYADMKRWSFHSRIAMLAMFAARYRTLSDRPSGASIVLMDRCIHELITFAALQHSSGNLSKRDYSIYRTLHDSFVLLAPPLDILIYLSCSEETSLKRLSARGRPFEAGVTEAYLRAIAEQYGTWLATLPDATRILSYDTDSDINLDDLVETILRTVDAKAQ